MKMRKPTKAKVIPMVSAEQPDELIGTVKTILKSETDKSKTEIVVSIGEFQDELRIDIREYLYSANYEGATKKGVNMTREVFIDVYKALTEVKDKLIEAGELNESDFD